MLRLTRLRAAGFACALTFAAGTAAAGPLLTLDSEQAAASAIVAAAYVGYEATGQRNVMTAAALEYSTRTLRALAAATTPAALAQAGGGMTFPCRAGGTFTARNSATAMRVVDIEFVDCLPYIGFDSTANGPLRLTLISNSFATDQIAGIRLGTRDRDFVIAVKPPSPEYSPVSTTNHNLTMLGSIAVPRNQQADGIAAKSFYELNGFTNTRNRYEIPGPAFEETFRNTAEHVLVSTAITADNDYFLYDEDVTLLWGAFATHYGERYRDYDSRYEVAGLRARWIVDYEAWTNTRTLDGAIRYTGPSQTHAGCLSGGYLFETRTPMHYPDADSSTLDAGELVINRDVNMQVFAPGNVPPGLPTPSQGMLLNVNVRGAGTFNVDTNALNGATMWALTGCPYL